MRKRLRKKKHIGEFREFGVEIDMTLRAGVDFDSFLDDFLSQAVEANGLAFGGGGGGDHLSGVVELGQLETCGSKLESVTAWLAGDDHIEKFTVGDLIDLWQ